jgi:hypothetical protein
MFLLNFTPFFCMRRVSAAISSAFFVTRLSSARVEFISNIAPSLAVTAPILIFLTLHKFVTTTFSSGAALKADPHFRVSLLSVRFCFPLDSAGLWDPLHMLKLNAASVWRLIL